MRGLENINKAFFESDNYYGFPEIMPVTKKIEIPKYIDFDTYRRKRNKDTISSIGTHFYIDDYKFQCVWNSPDKYITMFQSCDNIIMPDFSLYYDMPVALQIYNKYRNHWLSVYYSVKGVTVIPNVSLSIPNYFEWSFIGYPKKSVVAFSDIGTIRDSTCRKIVKLSYDEMINKLEPIQVLYFTRSSQLAPSECDVIELKFIKECL